MRDGKTSWINQQLRLQLLAGGAGQAAVWNQTAVRGDFIADAEFNIVSWKDEPPTETPYLRFYVSSKPGLANADFVMLSRQANAPL